MSHFPSLDRDLQKEAAEAEAAFRKAHPNVPAYVLEVPLTDPGEPRELKIVPFNAVPDETERHAYEAERRDVLCFWRAVVAW